MMTALDLANFYQVTGSSNGVDRHWSFSVTSLKWVRGGRHKDSGEGFKPTWWQGALGAVTRCYGHRNLYGPKEAWVSTGEKLPGWVEERRIHSCLRKTPTVKALGGRESSIYVPALFFLFPRHLFVTTAGTSQRFRERPGCKGLEWGWNHNCRLLHNIKALQGKVLSHPMKLPGNRANSNTTIIPTTAWPKRRRGSALLS